MNASDLAKFNKAIGLAQNDQKEAAYSLLQSLLSSNPNDFNLLLWAAFTNPDLNEADQLIRQAATIDSNNPALAQAQKWLAGEWANEKSSVIPLPPFEKSANPTAWNIPLAVIISLLILVVIIGLVLTNMPKENYQDVFKNVTKGISSIVSRQYYL